jgi:hypothetical protein
MAKLGDLKVDFNMVFDRGEGLDVVGVMVVVTGESVKAVRVLQPEWMALDVWLPRSQLHRGSLVKPAEEEQTLLMPKWLAEQKELKHFDPSMKAMAERATSSKGKKTKSIRGHKAQVSYVDENGQRQALDLTSYRDSPHARGVAWDNPDFISSRRNPDGTVTMRFKGASLTDAKEAVTKVLPPGVANEWPEMRDTMAQEVMKAFALPPGVIDRLTRPRMSPPKFYPTAPRGNGRTFPQSCAVCGAPSGERCTPSCNDSNVPDAEVVRWQAPGALVPPEVKVKTLCRYAAPVGCPCGVCEHDREAERRRNLPKESDVERHERLRLREEHRRVESGPSGIAHLPEGRRPKPGVPMMDEATLADLLCEEVP